MKSKSLLLCFIFLVFCNSLFAKTHSASDAVKQNIFVEPVEGLSDDFMRGVDISSLYEIEQNGGKYYNAQGKEDDLFNILKENGVNWVRLRVWNNPVDGGGSDDTMGQPLPGGLQIALIAGLFGLGFWYVRRRKATVA